MRVAIAGEVFFLEDEDGSGTLNVYLHGGCPDIPRRILRVDGSGGFEHSDFGPSETELVNTDYIRRFMIRANKKLTKKRIRNEKQG